MRGEGAVLGQGLEGGEGPAPVLPPILQKSSFFVLMSTFFVQKPDGEPEFPCSGMKR